MPSFTTILAGANFRPAEAKEVLRNFEGGEQLLLERDPENPYDVNAVKVLIKAEDVDEGTFHEYFIGFVAKADNPDIAMLLDSGHEPSSVTVIGMAGTLKPHLQIEFAGE